MKNNQNTNNVTETTKATGGDPFDLAMTFATSTDNAPVEGASVSNPPQEASVITTVTPQITLPTEATTNSTAVPASEQMTEQPIFIPQNPSPQQYEGVTMPQLTQPVTPSGDNRSQFHPMYNQSPYPYGQTHPVAPTHPQQPPCPTSPTPTPQYPYSPQPPMPPYGAPFAIEEKKSSATTMGVLSIILAFFIPLVGLILGFVSNSKEKELKAMGVSQTALGTIGIIVAIVRIVLSWLIFFLALIPSLAINY